MSDNPTIQIDMKFRLMGHFTLIARNSVTGESRIVADFDNLVVNQGLDFIGATPANSSSPCIGGCSVGTGTTPEAPTDTTMGSFLAGTVGAVSGSFSTTYQTTTTPYYVDTTQTWEFATGTAAGNLTEVGMIWIATSGSNHTPNASSPLFSRALIKNGSGTPITITILPIEILDVVYTIRMFVPFVDFTGSFFLDINGTPTSFSYITRPAQVISTGSNFWNFQTGQSGFALKTVNGTFFARAYQSSTFAFSAITAFPSGANGTSDAAVTGTYTSGSYSNTFSYTWIPSNANYGSGIGGFLWTPYPISWQTSISPAIMKTSVQQLTMVFNVSWSN